MELTNLKKYLTLLAEIDNGYNCYWEYGNEYGEPGYSRYDDKVIVLGYYWTRDNKGELQDIFKKYPRLGRALKDAGVRFEWCDEWYLDYETMKVWRTEPDSYSWQPSIIWDDNSCEYLTPDHDLETWIEWAMNDPARCLTMRCTGDNPIPKLEEMGFTEYDDGSYRDGTYESGWYGTEDDPKKVTEGIRSRYPNCDIVFVLTNTEQFRVQFSAMVREVTDNENDA